MNSGKYWIRFLSVMLCIIMIGVSMPVMASAALSTPQLTGASAGSNGIAISWNEVSGATEYRVFRKSGGSGWSILGDTSGTSFLDKNVKEGVEYTYTVRCVTDGSYVSDYDHAGRTASMKKAAAAANLDTPNLTGAVASGYGIKVSWDGVSGAEGYRVFRKTGGSSWKVLKDVDGTSYHDTNAQEGVTYTYTVRCLKDGALASGYDHVGVSCAWTSASAGKLDTPALLSATGESKGIRITWGKVSGASAYRIFRKTGSQKWSVLKDVGDVDNYLDTTANAGTNYTYTVRCLRNGKLVSDYEKAGITGSRTSSLLGTPKLVSATAEGSGIRITWDAVGGVYAYRVFRKTAGSGWSIVADVKGTSYLDNATSANTSYTYTVRCINASGKYTSDYDHSGVTGSWKSGATGAYPTPVLRSAYISQNTVKVIWDAVDGADSYQVYRKVNGGSWTRAGVVTENVYIDSNVRSGVRYTYTVRVRKSDGSIVSGFDGAGRTVNFYSMPEMVSAKSVDGGIQVEWKKSEGLTYYAVFRKPVGGSYSRIAVSTETSYIDRNMGAGISYVYTVRGIAEDRKTFLSDYDHTGKTATYVGKVSISSLSAEQAGVSVSWSGVSGAAAYRLFRKFGDGSWMAVVDTGSTSYTDTQAVNNTTYSYYVRALDSAGNYIGAYDEAGKSITYYATPTLKECERTSSGLVTTWEQVEGISTYAVYRKIASGGWTLMGYSSTTSYTDDSVPSGTKAYYTVRCVSADGSANLSSMDSIGIGETSYMNRPIMGEVFNEDGYTEVYWDEVDKANYYNVYRRTGAATGAWILVSTAQSSNWYVDTNVKNGGTYYYTAAASDASGNLMSEYDSTGISTTYYSKPVLKSVENAATGAKVTWAAVDGIGTYQIYRKTGNGSWTAIATATGTSYTDTSVAANGHYWYTVSCMSNGKEVSAYDYSGLDTTFYPAPGVTGLTVNNGSIKVSWNAIDGIGTYSVYRMANSATTWTLIATVNTTSYTDDNVASGTKYTYAVRCVSGGNPVSAHGDTKVLNYYLAVPSVTVSSTTARQVKIGWSKVSGATGYIVYRKTATSGWAAVATLGNVASYTNSNLGSGTVYYYMVVATGNNNSRSADGPAVSITVK